MEFTERLCLIIAPVGALLVLLARRRPNLREGVTLITAVSLFVAVANLLPSVLAGERPSWAPFEVLPEIPLSFVVEPLGMVYALIASFLWIFNSIFSIGYMRALVAPDQTRFYTFFALAIGSVMGIAFAGNLVTLFIFYEMLTFTTFPLVTHKRTPEAIRSGRIYLGFLLGTSTCFLLVAILWTWTLTGTQDFQPGGILAGRATAFQMGVLFVLYVLGAGKAAVMPFHFWLPAAMVAPTPVSALLHAVAVVKAGVFIVLKIAVYVIGIEHISSLDASRLISSLAAATIVIASIAALAQDNLKARLAYSTISQLSYIVLAASLGNSLAITGGGMHIAMHAFSKITLFFCAGAIYVAAHKTNVSEMTGLGRAMPITMTAFLIAALSNSGLPPLGGAWSKWYLFLGVIEADQLVFLLVLVFSSLLSLAYLLPIPIRAFFYGVDGSQEQEPGREAPWPCLVAIVVTATGCLVLFLEPDLLQRLASAVTEGSR